MKQVNNKNTVLKIRAKHPKKAIKSSNYLWKLYIRANNMNY